MHHKNINVVPGQLTSFDIIGVIIVLVVISMDTFSLSIQIWMNITVMIMRRAIIISAASKSAVKSVEGYEDDDDVFAKSAPKSGQS